MKCRNCGCEIKDLWHDWELCDKCGYRFNVVTNSSPDDNILNKEEKCQS